MKERYEGGNISISSVRVFSLQRKEFNQMKKPMHRFQYFKLLSFLWLAISAPMNSLAQPAIVAHRGFSAEAPENTLAAFERAIAVGADYFELDVMASKDGVPVVIHDETIDRTSSDGRFGNVDSFNAHELIQLSVGHPSKFGNEFHSEAIPTLQQALKLAKGRIKVCVEIKASGIEQAIIEVITQNEMEDDVIIFSFESSILQRIHQLNPRLSLLYLKEHCGIADLNTAREIHASHVGVGRATSLTSEFMKAAQDLSMGVWQWTVNDAVEIADLLERPVTGIITDRPDLAIELRGNR